MDTISTSDYTVEINKNLSACFLIDVDTINNKMMIYWRDSLPTPPEQRMHDKVMLHTATHSQMEENTPQTI